ncbi:MAG: NfeD family protein [Candidatus Cloacimonetes bacterium]|nr:NfeD family protein [Candidatus Cloacimonadota bacterium]
MEGWAVWIMIGIICMIVEIFTPGFLFMSFGIGAILTGVFSIFIDNITIQILLFTVITFLVFVNLRRLSKRLISENTPETNIFALRGKSGIITKGIPVDGRGYVKIGGEEWSAVSEDGKDIACGEKVQVVSFEGNKLIVKKLKIEEG